MFIVTNNKKSFTLYEEDTKVSFHNFKRLLKASFIIYADFESILKPATANKKDGSSSKKYHDWIVYSYGCKLICVNTQCSKTYKSYFGEDTIKTFITDMVHENFYSSKILDKIFINLLLWLQKIMKILKVLLNAWFAENGIKKWFKIKILLPYHWKIYRFCAKQMQHISEYAKLWFTSYISKNLEDIISR